MAGGPFGDDLKSASAATYSLTADTFDDPVLSFWDRFGRETVRRAALRPGDQVLDACCGTGASALPAAEAVGPAGSVLGIDIAEPALALARAKAAARGLSNVEFREADVERTGLASASFDAVICVFGIFFVPDMAGVLGELWRLVRPGGVLAVTVWGPDFMEPGASAFWRAAEAENAAPAGRFEPWTRVTDPAALAGLFSAAGAAEPIIEYEPGTHPLADPADWWKIVLGTGLRATVAQLAPAAVERVHQDNVERMRLDGVRAVQANVLFARSRR
ncbi:methyltransferase domain-containing protein [Streptosporangiaceae bacterium NEAU-GS5]|nr:methyltransferase domain-containing protein [Streptosporangiaceae bacterium NEAU-GS5]